jgi:hypothetical protein
MRTSSGEIRAVRVLRHPVHVAFKWFHLIDNVHAQSKTHFPSGKASVRPSGMPIPHPGEFFARHRFGVS